MRKWLFMMLAGYIWKKVTAKGKLPPRNVATSATVPVGRRAQDAPLRSEIASPTL